MDEKQVSAGLHDGTMVRGVIRINPRNYRECYLPQPNRDILVTGMVSRNRCLNGDEVAVQLFPRYCWRILAKQAASAGMQIEDDIEVITNVFEKLPPTADPSKISLPKTRVQNIDDDILQPTGRVVAVLKRDPNLKFVGHIETMKGKANPKPGQKGDCLFIPHDSRVPRMMIPLNQMSAEFFEDPESYKSSLVVASMTRWDMGSRYARGQLVERLGQIGGIEAETKGILITNAVDIEEFPESALEGLPTVDEGDTWQVPEEELAKRKDLRKECIFSIDPPTSRDLDDALSLKPLENGHFELGVHIADVTHFVVPGTELDDMAQSRATTTYMVQRAYPMLPRILCEQLCSLNPHCDRLAFSFIWEVTSEGKIIREWCGKSVIRSCAKLSYNHAQTVIDDPDIELNDENFPEVSNGFTVDQVKSTVLSLHTMAQKLRSKRFKNGALRLDKPKTYFMLDDESLIPTECRPYILKPANNLVEEFMLFANIAAAHKIFAAFPKLAMLRKHKRPDPTKLHEIGAYLKASGVPVNLSSGAKIQQSILEYSSKTSKLQSAILQEFISRAMDKAKYVCSGDEHATSDAFFHHYGLNVPFYTHFTSPIRRYADVMVHRLLQAALDHQEPAMTTEEVCQIADKCNERSDAAGLCQDASAALFRAVYVSTHGPLEEDAVVLKVLDRSIDIVVPSLAMDHRVGLEVDNRFSIQYMKETESTILTWREDEGLDEMKQTLSFQSEIRVKLTAVEKNGVPSVQVELVRPVHFCD